MIVEFASKTTKKKNCVKGVACGASCIAANKKCKASLTTTQKAKKTKTTQSHNANGSSKSQVGTSGGGGGIESYDQFEKELLQTASRINRELNKENFTEIYQIRREMGDKVSRENFDKWALEAQKKGLIQLIGGEPRDDMGEKEINDSIKTNMGAKRYYLKLLKEGQEKAKLLGGKPEEKRKIDNYESFRKQALDLIDKIDKEEEKGGNLTPIYKVRRAMGDNVSRQGFGQFLLEMQSKGEIQLIGGSYSDDSRFGRKEVEDSVTTQLGHRKYYIRRLNNEKTSTAKSESNDQSSVKKLTIEQGKARDYTGLTEEQKRSQKIQDSLDPTRGIKKRSLDEDTSDELINLINADKKEDLNFQVSALASVVQRIAISQPQSADMKKFNDILDKIVDIGDVKSLLELTQNLAGNINSYAKIKY